jgi:hypothetical protein
MDFCIRCGQQTEPGKSFCTRCGDPVRPPAAESAGPPAQQATWTQLPQSQGLPQQQGFPPPQGFPPGPQGFPPGPPGRGGPPRRDGRFRWAVVAGIVLAAVAAGAIVATIVVGSPVKHAGASSSPSTSGLPASSGQPGAQSTLSPAANGQSASGQPSSGPASTGPAAEQTAAQHLSQLLTQSISDRSKIVSAFNDVDTCGSGLAGDAQTFQQAATSRQNLLSQLGALPDASALPPQLLQSLTAAWQASVTADQDYAGWASDETAHGCRAHDTADAHYQATIAPNQQATTDKTTFVGLWNPIATKYGLPTYQQDQL